MSVVKNSSGIAMTFTVRADKAAMDGVSVVFDAFPTGITYASSSPSVGSYDAPSRTWTVGDLAKDATANIVMTFTLDDASALPVTVTGVASTTSSEVNTGNNTLSRTLDHDVLNSFNLTKVVSAATYTAQPGVDNYIILDGGANSVTLTLPASANWADGNGGYYDLKVQIMDDNTAVSTMTIDGDAGDTLLNDDGAGTAANTGITLVEGDFRILTPETGTPTNIYVLGQFV